MALERGRVDDFEETDELHNVAVMPVWIRDVSGDLRRVWSLGVPRIGERLTIDAIEYSVVLLTWEHSKAADGSLCLQPVLTLQPAPGLQG